MRILALVLMLMALPAYAESVPAPVAPVVQQPEAPKSPRADYRRAERSPLAGDFSEYTAGKIAFLRAELQITEAQEPNFASFVEILKRYSDGMNKHRETMREQRRDMQAENQSNLATRLGLRIGTMEQDVQALKILQRALAEFYAVLTDEQKKSADNLLAHLAR